MFQAVERIVGPYALSFYQASCIKPHANMSHKRTAEFEQRSFLRKNWKSYSEHRSRTEKILAAKSARSTKI